MKVQNMLIRLFVTILNVTHLNPSAFFCAGGANNLNPVSSEATKSKVRFPGRKGWGFEENGEWVKIALNVACID